MAVHASEFCAVEYRVTSLGWALLVPGVPFPGEETVLVPGVTIAAEQACAALGIPVPQPLTAEQVQRRTHAFVALCDKFSLSSPSGD